MTRPCLTLLAVLATTVAAAPHTLLDTNDSGPQSLIPKEFIQPIEDLENAASSHHGAYDGLGGIESHADDDEKGYLKKKASKGSKGYKHFDSYHKRDGDKWEGEKHTGLGGGKKGGDGGSYFTSSSYNYDSRDKDGKKGKLMVDADDDSHDHGEYSHDEEADHDGDHDRYDDAGHSHHHFDDHDHDHYDRDSGYDGEGDHNGYEDGGSYHEEMDHVPKHLHSIGSNLGSSAFRGGGGGGSPSQYHGGGGNGGGATSYYIRHY